MMRSRSSAPLRSANPDCSAIFFPYELSRDHWFDPPVLPTASPHRDSRYSTEFLSHFSHVQICEDENRTASHLFKCTSSHFWSSNLRLRYHVLGFTTSSLRLTLSSEGLFNHPDKILLLLPSAVSFTVHNGGRLN